MDLKDVIAKVENEVKEAGLAFHAGHHEVANRMLRNAYAAIRHYFSELSPEQVNELTETTTEKPADADEPTLAEGLGMIPVPQPSHPGAVVQTPGAEQANEKPVQ